MTLTVVPRQTQVTAVEAHSEQRSGMEVGVFRSAIVENLYSSIVQVAQECFALDKDGFS